MKTSSEDWISSSARDSFRVYWNILESPQNTDVPSNDIYLLESLLSKIVYRPIQPTDCLAINIQEALNSANIFATFLIKKRKNQGIETPSPELMLALFRLCQLSLDSCHKARDNFGFSNSILAFCLPLCVKCVKWLQSLGIIEKYTLLLSDLLNILAQLNILENFQVYSYTVIKSALKFYRRLFSLNRWGNVLPFNPLLDHVEFRKLVKFCEKIIQTQLRNIDCVFIETMLFYITNSSVPRYLWRESCLTWLVLYDFIHSSTQTFILSISLEMRNFLELNGMRFGAQRILKEMMENDSHLFELFEISLHITLYASSRNVHSYPTDEINVHEIFLYLCEHIDYDYNLLLDWILSERNVRFLTSFVRFTSEFSYLRYFVKEDSQKLAIIFKYREARTMKLMFLRIFEHIKSLNSQKSFPFNPTPLLRRLADAIRILENLCDWDKFK